MQFFMYKDIKVRTIIHIIFIGLIATTLCFFGISYFSYEDGLRENIHLQVEAQNTKIISDISLDAQRISSQDAVAHQTLEGSTKSLLNKLKLLKNGGILEEKTNKVVKQDQEHETLLAYMVELTEQIQTENKLLYQLAFRIDSLGNYHPKTDINHTKQNHLLQKIAENIENLRIFNTQLENAYKEDETLKRNYIRTGILLFSIVAFTILMLLYHWAITEVLKILGQVEKSSRHLLDGNLTVLFPEPTKDEIGDSIKNINQLTQILSKATRFATEVGKGNFHTRFEPTSENDQLGKALLEMRNNLKSASETRTIRKWQNEGISLFNKLLSDMPDDQVEFCYQIIVALVKFLQVNQGGFYVIEKNYNHEILKLVASYAYEKRKYVHQEISTKSGILGQTVQDKQIIITKDLPENYIHITSGLGHATPTHLMTIPLIHDDVVFGVLEIASFKSFKDHEVEFVKEISEHIASTLSNVRNNERMKTLLKESNIHAEQIKNQEEQVRLILDQFNEEQKKQALVLEEIKNKLDLLEKIQTLNHDFIFVIDKNYFITYMNPSFYQTYKKHGIELKTNVYAPGLFTVEEQYRQIDYYQKAFQGEEISEEQSILIAEKEKLDLQISYKKMDENHVLVIARDTAYLQMK